MKNPSERGKLKCSNEMISIPICGDDTCQKQMKEAKPKKKPCKKSPDVGAFIFSQELNSTIQYHRN
jgi:hypothetical protein